MIHKKYSILWLHSHFLYSTGGTRYVFEVAKRLSKKYNVSISVEKSSFFWKKEFSKNKIRVNDLLPFSSTKPFYWLLFPLLIFYEYKKLQKYISRYDVIISSMFPMNIIASRLKIPHVQICYEPFAFFYDTELIESFSWSKKFAIKLLSIFYRYYDFWGTTRSQILLTLNWEIASWITRIYRKKPNNVTYLGVETKLFKKTRDQELKNKYKNSKIILHSTDYTVLKGTKFVIEAMPLIVKEVRNTKLLVTHSIKNINELALLKRKAVQLGVEKNVEFIGCVPYENLPAYYSLADVVVFTGHPECKGASSASLTVVEALACETPVVRSTGGGEEVIDGKTGYLVDPRNAKTLGNAIIRILKNPSLGKKMGKAGRVYVYKKYNWDKVVLIVEESINKIIG